jgi:hypothetical protein
MPALVEDVVAALCVVVALVRPGTGRRRPVGAA